MAKTRAETESIAAAAAVQLDDCHTAPDVYSWYGRFFSVIGPKYLGTILNDKRLAIEAAARDLRRDVKRRVDAKAAQDRNNPYSDQNLYERGHPQPGTQTEWKREKDRQAQALKDIADEERRVDEIEYSEGEGERGKQR